MSVTPPRLSSRCAALAAFALLLAAIAAVHAQPPGQDIGPLLARGAIDYVYYCARCHGANGEGNSQLAAPALAGEPAARLRAQIAALLAPPAGAHTDGTHPGDVPTARQHANSHAAFATQLDSRAISGIADYLAGLVPPPPVAY